MTVWMLGLVMFTYLFLRDGGFHQFHPLVEAGIILMFWIFGLAGLNYFFRMQVVSVARDGNEVVIREYWPFKRLESRYHVSMLRSPTVRKIRDSEGDVQYLCIVTTPDLRELTVASYYGEARAREFVAMLSAELSLAT